MIPILTRRSILLGAAASSLFAKDALACHRYVSPVDGRVGCGAQSRDLKNGVSSDSGSTSTSSTTTSSGTTSSGTTSTVSAPQTGSRGDAGPPPGGSSDIPGSTGLWNPVQGINIPALSPTTTHNVSNASQLAAAINTINTTRAAGHHIVLANGSYSGNYTIYAQGTQANPIVIRPANFLGATLTDTLRICGSWVIVRGLNVRELYFAKIKVSTTWYRANNSRLSRCRMTGSSTPLQVEGGASYCCFDRNEVVGGSGRAVDIRPRAGSDKTFRNCMVWNLIRGVSANGTREPAVSINTASYRLVNDDQQFLFGWNRIQDCINDNIIQCKASGNNIIYNTLIGVRLFSITFRHGRRSYIGGNWIPNTSAGLNVRGEGHVVIGNYSPNGVILPGRGNIEGGSAQEPSWVPPPPGWAFAENVELIGNNAKINVRGPASGRPYAPLRTLIENHTGSITISAQSRQTIDRRNSSPSRVVPEAYLLQASQVGPYS